MKARVLIVEDSLTIQADLRAVLRAADFATTVCSTLAEARRALAHEDFDLVLLDLLLPDGDGLELLGELRAMPRTAQLAVMMLSSEADVSHRLSGLGYGASDYVGKPYDPAYVVRRACELTHVPEVDAAPPLVAAGKRRRLLVVDDSLSFRQLAAEELRKDGHDVVVAESGEEALELLKVQPVDCVLLDMVMPGLSGIEVARAIRALPGLAGVSVLMLTARFDGRSMAEALGAGVDTFCAKSADFDLLRAQVRNELRRRLVGGTAAVAAAPSVAAALSKVQGAAGSGGGSCSLFNEVVARSGLSPVIAASTLARVCRRAGVEAQSLDAEGLHQLLPSIRDTLRVFLNGQEAESRLQSIMSLARSSAHGTQAQAG